MQLRQINGIGPKTEHRLRDHGITTFAELAGADPTAILDALADQRGMSEEIVRSWIAAARRLMGAVEDEAPGAPRAPDAPTAGDGESFLLTVALDASGRLGRTTIVHDRSGAEASWPDWPSRQLDDFVRDQVPVPDEERRDELVAPDPLTEQPRRAADSHALAVDLGPRPGGATRALSGVVDPDELEVSEPTAFRASGLVAELGSSEVREAGEVRGVVEPGVPLRLDFGTLALPAGLHRLVAKVELLVDSSPRPSDAPEVAAV